MLVEIGWAFFLIDLRPDGHEWFDAAVAADLALGMVRDWFCQGDNATKIDSVIFAFNSASDEKLYVERWPQFFPGGPAASGPTATRPAARVYSGKCASGKCA